MTMPRWRRAIPATRWSGLALSFAILVIRRQPIAISPRNASRHNECVTLTADSEASDPLRRPAPGPLWRWVKVVSWVELTLFAALCFFWLAPGFPTETMIFGTAHGVGWIALCLFIWVAILRRQAPYVLLAATMTPVGPLGSVIAIELIERRRPAYRRS